MSDGTNNKTNQNQTRKKSAKDNIKVAVRCRPLLNGEKALCEIVSNVRKKQIGVVIPRSRGRDSNKLYTFDFLYSANTTQHHVFHSSIEPIISDVLSGYNCTVFAYGQTGSGKTYTMEGMLFDSDVNTEQHDGIIPRSITSIFHQIEEEEIESTVIVSHLEIYNEELLDLLSDPDDDTKKKKLTIYNDTKKKHRHQGVFVQGLEEIIVSSPQQIFDILSKSSAKRRTAATNLNQRSSRSHCIFTITIRMKTVMNTEEIVKTGTLNLVDLAGSESIGRSGAEDKRAKEAGHINTSLLTLGRVISALVERRQHIPYRESKLTRLLQESLGGSNKTLLIATISSNSPLEQTLSTLDYALRAKNIQNKPTLNVSMTKEKYVKELQVLVLNYKKQIDALRNEKGVYLPNKQYDNMTSKMEHQIAEIGNISALFEAEKSKLMEMNALFTKTNDKLNSTMEQKEGLIAELNDVSLELEEVALQLKQHQFVLDRYQQNEKELRLQAMEVHNVLRKTVKERDILYDKSDRIAHIEEDNICNWNEKQKEIIQRIAFVSDEMRKYREDLNSEMMHNLKYIDNVKQNIESMMEMMRVMHNDNEKHNKILVGRQEMSTHYMDKRVNNALDGYMEIHKRDYDDIYAKCDSGSTLMTHCIDNINAKLVCLQSEIKQLNDNLNHQYCKETHKTELFMRSLNECIAKMMKQMNSDRNEEINDLNEWKISQENLVNECKQYAMNEINALFDEISSKQMTFFESKHKRFNERLSTQNSAFDEEHLNGLQSMVNQYEMKQQKDSKCNHEKRNKEISDLSQNLENIAHKMNSDYSENIQSSMQNISKSIEESYKMNNDYISNEIKLNLNEFKTKNKEYFNELMECNNNQNVGIQNTEKRLENHKEVMNKYYDDIETYHKEKSVAYLNSISDDLNGIYKENEVHQLSKYRKTGETPLKYNIIYPNKFVETAPFHELLLQYNDENKDTIDVKRGNSSNKSISSETKSSSPYFMEDEIEIDFTEKELGFRMYGGDKNKNCFVRHCHSDPRVCDNAQIVAIDGIDVIEKSVGYIRTLLATTQRPIAIKFKNDIDGTPPCSAVASDDARINKSKAKKRQRSMIQTPRKKLNYITPNRKRHKKNSKICLLSITDINNTMDID